MAPPNFPRQLKCLPYRLHREKKVKIEEDKSNVRGVIAKGLGEGLEPMK